jgi:hypothetical protein
MIGMVVSSVPAVSPEVREAAFAPIPAFRVDGVFAGDG